MALRSLSPEYAEWEARRARQCTPLHERIALPTYLRPPPIEVFQSLRINARLIVLWIAARLCFKTGELRGWSLRAIAEGALCGRRSSGGTIRTAIVALRQLEARGLVRRIRGKSRWGHVTRNGRQVRQLFREPDIWVATWRTDDDCLIVSHREARPLFAGTTRMARAAAVRRWMRGVVTEMSTTCDPQIAPENGRKLRRMSTTDQGDHVTRSTVPHSGSVKVQEHPRQNRAGTQDVAKPGNGWVTPRDHAETMAYVATAPFGRFTASPALHKLALRMWKFRRQYADEPPAAYQAAMIAYIEKRAVPAATNQPRRRLEAPVFHEQTQAFFDVCQHYHFATSMELCREVMADVIEWQSPKRDWNRAANRRADLERRRAPW